MQRMHQWLEPKAGRWVYILKVFEHNEYQCV